MPEKSNINNKAACNMSSSKKKKHAMITAKIAIWALVQMFAEDMRFMIHRNSYTDVLKDKWYNG